MKIRLVNWSSLEEGSKTENDLVFDNLNRIINDLGHDCRIITVQSAMKTIDRQIDLNYYRYNVMDKIQIFSDYFSEYEKMFECDLIISNDCCMSMTDTKIPIVTLCNNDYEYMKDMFEQNLCNYQDYNEFYKLYTYLQKQQFDKSKDILALNKFMVKNSKSVICKNIDFGFADTTFEEMDLSGTALWVGSFNPVRYNFITELIKEFKDIKWALVFDHEVNYKPKQPNVTIYNQDKLNDLIHNCDFMISTSKFEPLNLNLLRGLKANKPIITYRTGWFFDCAPGTNDIGEVVTEYKYEAFKSAVEKILTGKYLPAKAIERELDIKLFSDRIKNYLMGFE